MSGPVAITGMGMVSAAGVGVSAFFDALAAGRSYLQTFEGAGRLPDHRAAPFGEHVARGVDIAQRVCESAAREALEDASLGASELRVGLAFGTALGAVEHVEALAAGRSNGDANADCEDWTPAALARTLAHRLGCRGPRATFSATCASALYALDRACADLDAGRADVVVCGGYDALSDMMRAGFGSLGAVRAGEGLELGEAACFVVLEPLAAAQQRGARIHGVIVGRGRCSDSFHLTSPDESGAGMIRAVERCLEEAAWSPARVGWVTETAGTSASYRVMYGNVRDAVFGRAPAEFTTWEHSVGHVLAATGACGLIHACHLLSQGAAESVVTLTVGFGGQNGATLVARPDALADSVSPPRTHKLHVRGRGVARQKPKDLEDSFPGRWNPRREMPENLGVLVHAMREAMRDAGWWTGPEDWVDAGQIIATDRHADASLWRFASDLQQGGVAEVKPSDFLFALPSTAAALTAMLFGLDRYQSTVADGVRSGGLAASHAIDELRAGRLKRLVLASLRDDDPSAAPMHGAAGAAQKRSLLAVAWCLESGEAHAPETHPESATEPPRTKRMVTEEQKLAVKKMLVEQLRLRMEPEDIGDDMPFFGEGLGLDSVDAIELVAAVEKEFNVVLANEDTAKEALKNVITLTEHVVAEGGLK